MSTAGFPRKDSRHTYFYVFADENVESAYQKQEETAEVTPDRAVRQAFDRFSREYSNATVHINPSDALRRALGIESLPAFAISDSELSLDGSLRDKPAKLPSILKFRERKRILESGSYVPRVEREIISLYPTPDKLYQFVRDLHLKNIDHEMIEAIRKIESEVRKIAGKKVWNTLTVVKRLYK
jgi:hypothetical protein